MLRYKGVNKKIDSLLDSVDSKDIIKEFLYTNKNLTSIENKYSSRVSIYVSLLNTFDEIMKSLGTFQNRMETLVNTFLIKGFRVEVGERKFLIFKEDFPYILSFEASDNSENSPLSLWLYVPRNQSIAEYFDEGEKSNGYAIIQKDRINLMIIVLKTLLSENRPNTVFSTIVYNLLEAGWEGLTLTVEDINKFHIEKLITGKSDTYNCLDFCYVFGADYFNITNWQYTEDENEQVIDRVLKYSVNVDKTEEIKERINKFLDC